MAGDDELHFASWQRTEVFDRAVQAGPRLAGALQLTLTDTTTGQSTTGHAPFTLMAAADIGGLRPGAVKHVAPPPFARDAETTKLVHLELWDADLPWRYTPRPTTGDRLDPWLALLVGTAEELRVESGRVTLVAESVLQAHPLDDSSRWAHTQRAGGRTTARILSPRGTEPGAVGLEPQREYVAVLVPTFNDAGEQMWTSAGVRRFGASLPAFHSWRFWTAESGDFETLAAALRVPPARDVGKAVLHYGRPLPGDGVDGHPTLEVRGAITSLQQTETVQPDLLRAVTEDLEALGHEVPGSIGLPRYGRPWLPEPDAVTSGWPHDLNDDPRFRGTAGLGLRMGIEAQEALVDAAVAQAGALREAGQRIGQLALGLVAGGRLWDRRVPTDPHRRLALLGPMTARLPVAAGGTVLDRITADGLPLVPGQLSSAAQRLLRDRTATTRHLVDGGGGGVDRTAALTWANEPEPRPDRATDGVPHLDAVVTRLGLGPPLEELLEIKDSAVDEVVAAVDTLLVGYQDAYRDRVREGADPLGLRQELAAAFFGQLQDRLQAALDEQGVPCNAGPLLEEVGGVVGDLADFVMWVLVEDTARWQLLDAVRAAVRHCMAWGPCHDRVGEGEEGFSCGDLVDHTPGPEAEPRRGVDLVGLSGLVSRAVDPRGTEPPAQVRLCSRLVGVDCSTLVPTEYPIGLDFPTWGLLRQYDREWLLPGADLLEKDSVTALQTNPAFVDAFMVGINTQFLSELRWRDLAVARTCTPLRMFWGQVDYAQHERRADIEPLAVWAQATGDPVGALGHQTAPPPDAADPTGSRLVLTFRTELFRRYPATLVYLVRPAVGDDLDALLSAPPELDMPDGTPDEAAWRAARRHLGPVFTGTLTPELTFFTFDVPPSTLDEYWLVLDEPPAELRFRNDQVLQPLDTTNGATVAASALDQPTRVAISGRALEQAGLV